MFEQPTPEHEWLHQLVGNWRSETECAMGPDEPLSTIEGTETVRLLGQLWTVGEGTMGCDETAGQSLMTLGYNPHTQRFIGSFVSSMMSHWWPYDGSLDASKKILTLDSVGPSFADVDTMAKYQDRFQFIDENHRVLTSQFQLASGDWKQFMTAHYYRIK